MEMGSWKRGRNATVAQPRYVNTNKQINVNGEVMNLVNVA